MASSMGRLLRTWAPTALGSSMLVLEIPIIYATATRSTAGSQGLAALGICVAILVVVNSPALAITPLVVTAHGEHDLRRLWRHALLTGLAGAAVLAALATAPPLAELLRLTLAPDEALLSSVRTGLLGLVPNALGVAMRRYLHGRLIVASRTRPITTATLARLGGTFVLAWTGTALLPQHGVLVAASALSVGAFTETIWLAFAVRTLPRPTPSRRRPMGDLLRRHASVSAARLYTMIPMLITTAAIAHSAHAVPSLIVWPALYELAMLFASPTTDWESVTAMALREDRRDRSPRRLTLWLATGFTAAFAIVLGTGLAEVYLATLLAVPAALRSRVVRL